MKERAHTELRVARRTTFPTDHKRVEKHRVSRQHRLPRPSTSTAESSQYTWTPIDQHRKEIRVLDLYPGVGHAPLQGRLRNVFLRSPPKREYETISYAWGDTSLVDNIRIGDRSIRIPASAGLALRSMRSPGMIRTLWIDCICIDQDNDREKGHQVGLMVDIFQSSIWTLAHLGDDNDGTAKRAFDGVADIYKALQGSAEGLGISDWSQIKIRYPRSLRAKVDLKAIKGIMMRPYFRRLWIVQEAVLSIETILYCNTSYIRLNALFAAASWLLSPESLFADDFSPEHQPMDVTSFLNLVQIVSTPDELSLSRVLCHSVMLQCSEPRDRVFGLLSLLELSTREHAHPVALKPDYTKSVVEVFCDATRACLDGCDDPWILDWLGYERSGDNMIKGLPSWVPSWYCGKSTQAATRLPSHTRLWAYKSCSADTPLVPETSVGKVLSIRGVVVGSIAKLSDAVISRNGSTDSCTYVDFMSKAGKLLFDGDPLASVFRNLERLDHALSAGCKDAELMRWWLKYLGFIFPTMQLGTNDVQNPTTRPAEPSGQDQAESDVSDDTSPEAQAAKEAAMRKFDEAIVHCYDRKVFLTQSGLLGIGPRDLQNGDVIAVSKLSQWPLVLRRREDLGLDYHTVIGASYVEGLNIGQDLFAAAAEGDGTRTLHLV